MFICVHLHIHVRTSICTCTYMCIHTNTYTHTHTHILMLLSWPYYCYTGVPDFPLLRVQVSAEVRDDSLKGAERDAKLEELHQREFTSAYLNRTFQCSLGEYLENSVRASCCPCMHLQSACLRVFFLEALSAAPVTYGHNSRRQ
jgi:hypothetical protein